MSHNHKCCSFFCNTFAKVDILHFFCSGGSLETRLSSHIFSCRLLFCAPTQIIINSIQLVLAGCLLLTQSVHHNIGTHLLVCLLDVHDLLFSIWASFIWWHVVWFSWQICAKSCFPHICNKSRMAFKSFNVQYKMDCSLNILLAVIEGHVDTGLHWGYPIVNPSVNQCPPACSSGLIGSSDTMGREPPPIHQPKVK